MHPGILCYDLVGEEARHDRVDLLQDLVQVDVGFLRSHLQFGDEPIDLVEHEDGLDPLP